MQRMSRSAFGLRAQGGTFRAAKYCHLSLPAGRDDPIQLGIDIIECLDQVGVETV